MEKPDTNRLPSSADVIAEANIVVEQPPVVNGTPDKMVLRTENLVKKYRQRTVVNHVSIDVTQGEIVGLLGQGEQG